MQNIATTVGLPLWALALILAWTLIWKGIALWKAARLSEKWWFAALLVVNTFGILEIIYIFIFARRAERAQESEDVE